MAKFVAFLLLALLVITMLQTPVLARGRKSRNKYGNGSLKLSQCPKECLRRCSKTQHWNPCWELCNKCCKKCLCVPPGTYGNKQLCSCYNNWKTQQGGPKCP